MHRTRTNTQRMRLAIPTSPQRPPEGGGPGCSRSAPMCCVWKARTAASVAGAKRPGRGFRVLCVQYSMCCMRSMTYLLDQPFHLTRYSTRPCNGNQNKWVESLRTVLLFKILEYFHPNKLSKRYHVPSSLSSSVCILQHTPYHPLTKAPWFITRGRT